MATNANDYVDEDQASLMWRRFTRNPFLAIGFTGFFVTAAVGLYKMKSRPKYMSPALYLVQLRVVAQSVVIGTLSVGMIYGMVNHHLLKKD